MSNNMELDNTKLLDFLGEIDKELDTDIVLVAVGGTAMTLLNRKPSTRDVDFTIPSQFYDIFQAAMGLVPHGFEVQSWRDGDVFMNILPDDYLDRSSKIKTNLKNITLRALHPVDIVVTKIGRLNERDIEDIETCIKKFKLSRDDIEKRAGDMGYAGNDDAYAVNLGRVIKEYF